MGWSMAAAQRRRRFTWQGTTAIRV
jgi:hypothetical protein